MLETERTKIRWVAKEDFDQVHNLRQDKEIIKRLGGGKDKTMTKRQLNMALNDRKNAGCGMLLICENNEEQIIGYCRIKLSSLDRSGGLEIMYAILSSRCRKGFITEVLSEVLPWAFEETKANYIYGRVEPDNIASIKTLKKLGFKEVDDHTYSDSAKAKLIFSIDKPEVSENE